ncbi:hypothetical protein Anas_10546 [Armadillidium nasatum]|uniref:Transmembrane protein n=1 Tax=Armadillidium nasatum TaxID=96803 RepID=A0A5N5SP94_9CRUS|nr:hypothetical protein Anas_10546 [Armadillidium nasatum]
MIRLGNIKFDEAEEMRRAKEEASIAKHIVTTNFLMFFITVGVLRIVPYAIKQWST